MIYPCNMTLAYLGDGWQEHANRPGYLAEGNEPGVDFVAQPQQGIPIVAVMDGTIRRDKDAGYNDGYGTYCEIEHGKQADGHSYRTLYAHLASNPVKVGQKVRAGDQIGVMGTTGNSDCIHLHFVMWRDGKNVDPLPFLSMSTTPPVVTPAQTFTLPNIPALPMSVLYKTSSLVTKFIRVRVNQPDGMMIDRLNPGDLFQVVGWSEDGGDYWFLGSTKNGRIGWAAAYYQGKIWLEPVP